MLLTVAAVQVQIMSDCVNGEQKVVSLSLKHLDKQTNK